MGRRILRVLIADDHPLVADALGKCVLGINPAAEIEKVTTFEDAVEQVAAEAPFDLLLLDYRMPGIQGLKGLHLMRSRFPELRVAMVSGYAEGQQILEAMELGAVGFIPKDLTVPALVKALELILMGETFVPAKALLRRGMSDASSRYEIGGPLLTPPPNRGLTPREREVLGWVGHGKPNKRIAELIGTKEMTVAFHLKNVFRKLGVSNRTEAASTARKLGLQGDDLSST